MIGDIVEGVSTGLLGTGGDPQNRPRSGVNGDSESVETAAHIEDFTGRDEVSRSEFELLAACAQRKTLVRFRGGGEIHEGLMDFERVLIGKPGPAHAAGFDTTLKLREKAHMLAGAPIGVQKIALQQKALWR